MLELRGKSLLGIILLASGLDFLLFGCKSTMSTVHKGTPTNINGYQMTKVSSAASSPAMASKRCWAIPAPR